MQTITIKLTLTLLFVLMFNPLSFAQSIEGTYVLESRELANGTVIKPPQIMGLYNLEGGYINFNLANKDQSGKVQSISYVGKYRFTGKEYYQEILFVSINDEIGGQGIKYDFNKKSGTSAVKIAEGKIEFPFPPNNAILATFEGNTFKAKTANGAYTDNWKKIH
ncbi:MAG: hypothetical protein WBC96_05150 [Thermodesulfobacteriota bacterium]